VAILGAFTALRGFAQFTDVSVFAVNVVTILGLGLAIDYGLFMVSRFREEIRRQPTIEDAVVRTMATAGRTVAVSGVTVVLCLAGLLIFPQVRCSRSTMWSTLARARTKSASASQETVWVVAKIVQSAGLSHTSAFCVRCGADRRSGRRSVPHRFGVWGGWPSGAPVCPTVPVIGVGVGRIGERRRLVECRSRSGWLPADDGGTDDDVRVRPDREPESCLDGARILPALWWRPSWQRW
jgi:hypothetical protein